MKKMNGRPGPPAEKAVPGRKAEDGGNGRYQSGELYRALLEMSPDAVYLSEKGVIIEANQAAAALFDIGDAIELVGRPLTDFAHPDSKALIEEREKNLFSGEAELPLVEEKLVRPDGSTIYVEVKSRSFFHQGRLLVQSIARNITDRRKIEQELAGFKRQMEYILGATRTSVVVIDTDLNITYLSPGWEGRLGQVNGRKCYRYFENQDCPCRPCRILDAVRTGKVAVIEEPRSGEDGRAVQVHIVPFQDEDGKWMAAEFTIDITELKEAGDAVRSAAQQWQASFDAINDGIALVDDHGVVQRCNLAMARILGRPEGGITGMPLHDLITGERDGARQPDYLNNLKAHKRRIVMDVKSGDRWLGYTFDPMLDGKGNLSGLVFILKDFTEVRQAQEATRLMIEAIEQMDEGVMIFDTSERIIYANPALERITGYSREEIISRSDVVPLDHKTPDFVDYWRRVWEAVAAEGIWRGAKTSVRKDGSSYEQELVASVVKDQNSEIISYLVVVRDVTDQKRLQSIAEAATTLNNIGFIFSGVRHELGNPVNSIKLATSILSESFDTMDDRAKRDYLARITSDVQRLEALLKVLHSFSMFEDLSLGQVELCSFVRDLMPTVEPDFARASIVFDYQFPKNGCTVLADRRALYQIVVNLLTNSFNALSNREQPAIIIRVSCGADFHRFEVEDNGCGMSQEVKNNMFKPFYTTRPGGTGLGMVICQKLVLAMNGTLEVESESGRGTRVSLLLPRG